MQGERKEKRRKPEHKLFSKKEAAFLVCQLFFQAKCNVCSAIPRWSKIVTSAFLSIHYQILYSLQSPEKSGNLFGPMGYGIFMDIPIPIFSSNIHLGKLSHFTNRNLAAIWGWFPWNKPWFPGLGRTGFGRDEIDPDSSINPIRISPPSPQIRSAFHICSSWRGRRCRGPEPDTSDTKKSGAVMVYDGLWSKMPV